MSNSVSWQFVSGLEQGEGWEELEKRALAPGSWTLLPPDIKKMVTELKTDSIYRASLLGLLLWHHHQKAKSSPELAITARVLLGLYRLQPGSVKDALSEVLAQQEHMSIYLDIVRDLEKASAESSDYHYDSLLISHVSLKDLEK